MHRSYLTSNTSSSIDQKSEIAWVSAFGLFDSRSLLALGEVKIMGKAWWEASRQSSGISPNPDEVTEAVIQVFAARAFSWRGILGVHTWIAVKPTNASEYTVYQLVGWRLRRGEDPVVIQRDIPDRLWYDAVPELLGMFAARVLMN